MNKILRKTAMASALAIAAMAFSNVSVAQTTNDQMRKCIGDACPGQGMKNGNDQVMPNNNDQNAPIRKLRKKGQSNDQVQDMQDGDDQGGNNDQLRKLRKKSTQSNDQYQDNNDNDQIAPRKKMRRADWKFDSGRHQRRRSKDTTFRFYFGGFWYPQPYWDEPYYVDTSYGISCREGRNIVSERFNRVRVVECSGRTFTYIGRRHGDDFQVVLNSRSGRIISAREL